MDTIDNANNTQQTGHDESDGSVDSFFVKDEDNLKPDKKLEPDQIADSQTVSKPIIPKSDGSAMTSSDSSTLVPSRSIASRSSLELEPGITPKEIAEQVITEMNNSNFSMQGIGFTCMEELNPGLTMNLDKAISSDQASDVGKTQWSSGSEAPRTKETDVGKNHAPSGKESTVVQHKHVQDDGKEQALSASDITIVNKHPVQDVSKKPAPSSLEIPVVTKNPVQIFGKKPALSASELPIEKQNQVQNVGMKKAPPAPVIPILQKYPVQDVGKKQAPSSSEMPSAIKSAVQNVGKRQSPPAPEIPIEKQKHVQNVGMKKMPPAPVIPIKQHPVGKEQSPSVSDVPIADEFPVQDHGKKQAPSTSEISNTRALPVLDIGMKHATPASELPIRKETPLLDVENQEASAESRSAQGSLVKFGPNIATASSQRVQESPKKLLTLAPKPMASPITNVAPVPAKAIPGPRNTEARPTSQTDRKAAPKSAPPHQPLAPPPKIHRKRRKKPPETKTPFRSTLKNPTENPLSFKLQAVGPRTIGGIQDQTYAHRTPACACSRDSGRLLSSGKKTACLKLYCPCFSHGSLCTERCACSSACANHTGAQELRTQAISETLLKDSDAFRLESAKTSELQRLARTALNRGEKPHPGADQPSLGDEDPVAFVRNSLLRTQLPPSYYTVPFKGGTGQCHRSLAFSLVHPDKTKRSKRKRSRATPPVEKLEQTGKRRIVLSPTESAVSAARADAIADGYFASIRASTSQDPAADNGSDAAKLIKSIETDAITIKKSMEAAQASISARFFQGGELQEKIVRDLGYAIDSGETGKVELSGIEESTRHLYCDESMEPTKPAPEKSNIKDLMNAAAQEVALVQETTKIIRRYTRVLCAKRTGAIKNVNSA